MKDHLADPVFAGSAIALVRDLVEPDAARDLVRTAIEKVGVLDGLVNCAAWSLHKALVEHNNPKVRPPGRGLISEPHSSSARSLPGCGSRHRSRPCRVDIAS